MGFIRSSDLVLDFVSIPMNFDWIGILIEKYRVQIPLTGVDPKCIYNRFE